MSKVYDAALQTRVRQFIKESGLSQAKAAPMMGTTSAVMSLWIRSIYDNGNIEKVESDIAEFFKLQDEHKAVAEKAMQYSPTQGYIATSISEDIYKLIRYAQIEKGLILAYGDSGVGKTEAAGKFKRDNPSATLYIKSTPATSSLRETMRAIARELKISDILKTGDLSIAVEEKLSESGKMVIIDEAQNLCYKALEQITRWTDPDIDTRKSTIPLALIGSVEIHNKMHGRHEERFFQQSGRVLLSRYYRKSMITVEDVNLMFPLLHQRNMQKEQKLLLGIMQSESGVRGAVKLYNNAINSENISYDGLLALAREQGIRIMG